MIRPDHLRFKMYGVSGAEPLDIVDARAFSEKLATLLQALRAADKAANGQPAYEYRIVGAAVASMDFTVQEFLRPRYRRKPNESSIGAFNACLSAVAAGRADQARRYGPCARHIGRLGRGSGKRFGFAELWARSETPVLIDEVLYEKAEVIVSPPPTEEHAQAQEENWFRGFVVASFDGTLKVGDTRGSFPQGTLLLTAGHKEIDCVFPGATGQQVGHLLDKRARFDGSAFYDGKSGLPRRFEVRGEPRLVRENADFERWKGSFEPFEVAPWDEAN